MTSTLRDVALAAGVSVKTVSNVVNGYVHVSPSMREKVERALADLDYRPNMAARNLRRGRTGLLALGVPSLRNPYFAELAELIVETAARHDLTVLVDCTTGDAEREQLVMDGFRTHMVDGLILCPRAISTEQLQARRPGTPLVLLGERDLLTADTVAIDSHAVALAATQHLVAAGRRTIGVVGFSAQTPGDDVSARRVAGYREAVTDASLGYDESLVEILGRGRRSDDAGQAVARLREAHPDLDAVFCFNDEFALGVIRGLVAAGVRVPDDIAVIGIDDVDAGRLTRPSLSTVAPDKRMIAEQAVGMLLERIDGDESGARQVVAGFTLVPRESTGN